MSPIRVLGSGLGILTGLLAVYFEYTIPSHYCSGSGINALCFPNQDLSGVPTVWLAVAGAALAAVSLVSLGGFRVTFYGGAVLSVMVLAADLALNANLPADEWEGIAVLSLVTLVIDVVASRPARALSEKDSPLNLPVFG